MTNDVRLDPAAPRAAHHRSTTHGDLRVSHFFALHSLQIIPLVALALSWVPLGAGARWTLLVIAIVANAILALSTLLQALAARPLWST